MPRTNGQSVSHDQNFKNLILDYPIQAIELFSPQEAEGLDDTVRIVPMRQEQLKERLGERFRELDVPLLAEWPDGQREALLFVLEEETNPNRFSRTRKSSSSTWTLSTSTPPWMIMKWNSINSNTRRRAMP